MLDCYAVSVQGGRDHMEDTYCLIPDFNNQKDWLFGGVYDGHGGKKVAELAAKEMPKLFLKFIKQGESIEEAFRIAYQRISESGDFIHIGCTALSFFIRQDKMFIANAGDCRIVMVNKNKIKQITNDHDINNTSERARIIKNGGEIKGCHVYRGDYGLMPTRTLGDHYFKSVGIISEPEMFMQTIPKKRDVFFIVATDGLWSQKNNRQVADIVSNFSSAEKAAKALEKGPYHDNICIIVVKT